MHASRIHRLCRGAGRSGVGGEQLGGRGRGAKPRLPAGGQGPHLCDGGRRSGQSKLGHSRSHDRSREAASGRGGEEPRQRGVRRGPGDQRRGGRTAAGAGRPGRPGAGHQRQHLRPEPSHARGLPAAPAGGRVSLAGDRRARLVPGAALAGGRAARDAVQHERLRRPGAGGGAVARDPAAAAEPRARLAALQGNARVLRPRQGQGAAGGRTGGHPRRPLRRSPRRRGRGRRRGGGQRVDRPAPSKSSSRRARTSSRRRRPAWHWNA